MSLYFYRVIIRVLYSYNILSPGHKHQGFHDGLPVILLLCFKNLTEAFISFHILAWLIVSQSKGGKKKKTRIHSDTPSKAMHQKTSVYLQGLE